jgi:uncharacterized SAM-dependent methyltransferase
VITRSNERILEVAVHETEFPEAFVQSVVEGLGMRRLPGKWLYHDPAQARLWLDYHDASSPSRADPAMAALYREAFSGALDALGQGSLCAVSLGCGGGRKDAELLALAQQRRGADAPPSYAPVDASQPLVLEAALHVARRFPHLAFHPLAADLARSPDLRGWLDAIEPEGGARLFTCFGMVPNMEPAPFLAFLAGVLRAGDGLLLSANLSPGGMAADRARILPQYDNPQALRWYEAALEALGLQPAHVALQVSAARQEDDDAAWRIVVEALVVRDTRLEVFGQAFSFSRGERLQVFHSNRFTAEAFRGTLAQAGLEPQAEWLHKSGEEGIFFCKGGRGET